MEQTKGLIDDQKVQRKEALTKQGDEFYKLNQYQSAIDLWEKVLILDPNDEPVKKSLAQAKEKWEEQKKEQAAAEERARLEKGWAALNAKNADKAKEVAEGVLKDNPSSDAAKLLLSQANGRLADDLLIKGRYYVKSNDYIKAYNVLKTASELDPANKIVQDLLDDSRREVVKTGREEAMNLYSQQKYKEALEKFNFLLEVDPKVEDIASARQETIRKLGETVRVEAETYNKLGLKAYDEGNYREAVKYWKKVLELVPDHVNAKRNLERVRQQLNQ
jgi:tetratricopeptide (TPR) repeat protein